MKPVGTKCEFEEERNRDLMSVYHRLLDSHSTIRLRELMTELVNSPSQRFWVTEERAAIVMSQMMRGDKLEHFNDMKRQMFGEIYRRVMEMRRSCPGMPMADIIFEVIHQQAPRFYLTPGSAKVIIHKIKKKCFEERMRKLRHLL